MCSSLLNHLPLQTLWIAMRWCSSINKKFNKKRQPSSQWGCTTKFKCFQSADEAKHQWISGSILRSLTDLKIRIMHNIIADILPRANREQTRRWWCVGLNLKKKKAAWPRRWKGTFEMLWLKRLAGRHFWIADWILELGLGFRFLKNTLDVFLQSKIVLSVKYEKQFMTFNAKVDLIQIKCSSYKILLNNGCKRNN